MTLINDKFEFLNGLAFMEPLIANASRIKMMHMCHLLDRWSDSRYSVFIKYMLESTKMSEILINHLYIGNYRDGSDETGLLQAGFTHVINTSQFHIIQYKKLKYTSVFVKSNEQ